MGELEDVVEEALAERTGLDDAEVAAAKRRLPDSGQLRAAIVGVLIFAGAALGKDLSYNHWVDAAVTGYTVAAPVALAWWFRRQHKDIRAAVAAPEPAPTGRHAKQ